jgi:hypothetical protein
MSRIRALYANNFGNHVPKSNKKILNIYQKCTTSSVLPSSMNIKKYQGKLYAVDPKSPLSIRELVTLLGRGSPQIFSVAAKLGLRHPGLSQSETKSLVCDALTTMGITEPVLLGSSSTKKNSSVNTNLNLGQNRNLGNLGNTNGMNNNKNLVNNNNMIQKSLSNFNSQRSINKNGLVRNANGSIVARNNGTPLRAVKPKVNKFSLSESSSSSNSFSTVKPKINTFTRENTNAENRKLQERLNKIAERI